MGSHMDGVASSLGLSEVLPPLLRNFSENQRLKQASYFCFNSLHSGPSEFISDFDSKWCTNQNVVQPADKGETQKSKGVLGQN